MSERTQAAVAVATENPSDVSVVVAVVDRHVLSEPSDFVSPTDRAYTSLRFQKGVIRLKGESVLRLEYMASLDLGTFPIAIPVGTCGVAELLVASRFGEVVTALLADALLSWILLPVDSSLLVEL